jgi:hypothetical protein
MALSPNYGFPEPDNSSLVKNGAQDIRALGDAVDTAIWNVGFGQAGKNKIINGDFGVWQRGTSFTPSSTIAAYGPDRFGVQAVFSAGTFTASQQTFTPAAAPVAGYEGQYFLRYTMPATGSITEWDLRHKIEDVRTFAGQTVTLSLWMKSSTAHNARLYVTQNFGSGGSASVGTDFTFTGITSSWTRYSVTVAVPSIAGKTIGTSSFLEFDVYATTGITNSTTIDFWGVQVEYGSKATPFETATGTVQGELAACQRYYWRSTASAGGSYLSTSMGAITSATVDTILPVPVTMRTFPTAIEFSAISVTDGVVNYSGGTYSLNSSLYSNQLIAVRYAHGSSTLTQYRPYAIQATTSSGYVGFSAEL